MTKTSANYTLCAAVLTLFLLSDSRAEEESSTSEAVVNENIAEREAEAFQRLMANISSMELMTINPASSAGGADNNRVPSSSGWEILGKVKISDSSVIEKMKGDLIFGIRQAGPPSASPSLFRPRFALQFQNEQGPVDVVISFEDGQIRCFQSSHSITLHVAIFPWKVFDQICMGNGLRKASGSDLNLLVQQGGDPGKLPTYTVSTDRSDRENLDRNPPKTMAVKFPGLRFGSLGQISIGRSDRSWQATPRGYRYRFSQ